MPKNLRDDADRWRELLRARRVSHLWHFTPLACVPCILHHGAVLSIQELERRGLVVPQRASRDDDIANGVGDVVKLSVLPYWKMLGASMRQGVPEAMLEFSIEPVLWSDTTFGNSNVWEACWVTAGTFEFAVEKVFVRQSQWDGQSPPEIYVANNLPLAGVLMKIHTVLDEERASLKACLDRLGYAHFDIFAAGFSPPFPSAAREDYLKHQPNVFKRVSDFLAKIDAKDLSKGVNLE